jgi:hypothetical protein
MNVPSYGGLRPMLKDSFKASWNFGMNARSSVLYKDSCRESTEG